MHQVNSFTINAAPGSIGKLQKPASFPEHKRCTRIRVEATVPVKNTSGVSKTLTNADAVALMVCIFGSWNLAFGFKSPDPVDNAKTFERMRELCIAKTGRDMIFNNKQLGDYSHLDSDAIVIAAGATAQVVCEFIRPFIIERFSGGKILEWCPGATQMKQIDLQVVRGLTMPTDTTQDGAASVTVIYDTVDADHDAWVAIPRLHLNELGGQDHVGPQGGGALICLWERTEPGASTDLTLVSLLREGDAPVHEQVSAARISRDAQLLVPQGSKDLNTMVTVLFQPEEQLDLEHLPTASAFLLRQHNNDLKPMQTVWLYAPTVTPAYRDQVIAPNALGDEAGAAVKLVTSPALSGKDVGGHISAVSGVGLLKPSHPRFNLVPGRQVEMGKAPFSHIPDVISAAIKGFAASTNTENAAARLSTETKALAKFIPGARSAMRGAQTPELGAIGKHLAPSSEVANRLENMLRRLN